MSDKSKNSKGQALDRPFNSAILRKAKEIVANYEIVIAFEDGEWYGHGLELPGAHGDGKTSQAAVADTREAMIGLVAYMLEVGERPPEPAREGHRSVQINIRVTPEEKAVLESRSRSKGFRGLSDFIRSSVLAEK
jgi:predicted RNase H-like HicB family nuclease